MDGTTTFGKQHGVLISKKIIGLIAGIFLIGLIATGLLAYNLTSCPAKSFLKQYPPSGNQNESSVTSDTPSTFEDFTSTSDIIVLPDKKLDVRLPKSVFPKSYHVKIIPFIFEGNFTFNGEVDIVIKAKEETNNVTLHFDDITIDESTISLISLNDNSGIPIERIENDTNKMFLIFHFEAPLQAEKLYKIHIQYTGILNDLLQGFYRSSYTVGNHTR